MADRDVAVAPRVVGAADAEAVDGNEAAVAVRAVAGGDVAARAARGAAAALEPVHARLVAGLAHAALGVPHARAPRTMRDHRVLLVAVRVHSSAVRTKVQHQALGHRRDVRAVCVGGVVQNDEWHEVQWVLSGWGVNKHRCVWHASFTTAGYEALASMAVQFRTSLFRFLLEVGDDNFVMETEVG